MTHHPIITTAGLLLLATTATLSAQVTTVLESNPPLVSGANSINPNNRELNYFSGSNATLVTDLKANSGYAAIQAFDGYFVGKQAEAANTMGNSYIVNYGGSAVDVRLSFASTGFGTNNAAHSGSAPNYSTSPGAALDLRIGGNKSAVFRIDFGTWSGDAFVTDRQVDAVGFTFSGTFGNLVDDTATVTYYNSADSVLSTQTFTHADSTAGNLSVAAFSGYANATPEDLLANVSYLTITYSTPSGGSTAFFGLDDLGFSGVAVIPEPNSAGVLAGLAVFGMMVVRRRRTA